MSRDSPNVKEVAGGGSIPDKFLLYSVCTAVEYCKNYRGVHEYALFLTTCTELPTTNNKKNNGDLYYHQRMSNLCLV